VAPKRKIASRPCWESNPDRPDRSLVSIPESFIVNIVVVVKVIFKDFFQRSKL
jgi:hypothetical protein